MPFELFPQETIKRNGKISLTRDQHVRKMFLRLHSLKYNNARQSKTIYIHSAKSTFNATHFNVILSIMYIFPLYFDINEICYNNYLSSHLNPYSFFYFSDYGHVLNSCCRRVQYKKSF